MLLPWILSLAASFLLPATGEVVDSFESCKHFFLDGKAPEMEASNPTRICQFYKSKYRFATMYDQKRRIPIFSAYKYETGRGKRKDNWMIEPQLALPSEASRKSMESERRCKINHKLLENSQAVSKDYQQITKGTYNRGHLLPVSHQPDQDSKDATFTLTNIVPQFRNLNNGHWEKYERNMKIYTKGCHATYVIVGAVPGTKLLKNRVTIPSHIWAAACCVAQGKGKSSWAVIAKNDQNKVDQHSLKQLEAQLAKHYGKEVNLFNRACYARHNQPNNSTKQMQADYKRRSVVV